MSLEQSDAYSMIDRYLRNNLGDDNYAEFSAALDAVAAPIPQQVAEPNKDCPQPELCGSRECEFCRDTAAQQAQPERAPSDAISAHLLDSREKNIRCVKPLSCPKCHALWLFWPSEQSGFATDTLSVKSATHCDYCENARADQLSTLDRVQPQATPLPDHEIVTMYAECPRSDAEMIEFARAIEAAHGINGMVEAATRPAIDVASKQGCQHE